MLYKAVTIVCLALLALQVLFLVGNLIFKKRRQRIAFFRGFKKGKFAVIYLTAIPLYFIGHLRAGQKAVEAFFSAINKMINLVVLKYETGSIKLLMEENPIYRFTVYFCFVLVGINAVLLTVSLTAQHIWCKMQSILCTNTRKNTLYLFGNNSNNVEIYKSDKARKKLIIDNISGEDCENLYMDRISYISADSPEEQMEKMIRGAKSRDRESIFVVNTGDDMKNIALCRKVIDVISSYDKAEKENMFLKIKIFAFGDPIYRAIYEDIVSDSLGCIHYVNKYQKIAMDFIDRYPLAFFMNGEQIDYESSLVKKDVNINLALVGFGRTNQEIFLTSVANNQFLCEKEGKTELKKVNYHIFDKERAENNKNLNHSYYRYKTEMADMREEDYLPLPSLPAEEIFHRTDINDREFYSELKAVVTRNRLDANFVVIAFGDDLENIDLAQKLVEKRSEWDIDNFIIFVNVRTWHKEQTLLEQSGCYFIGNEKDTVCDIERIISDKIFRMAMLRNEIYDLEYDITHTPGIKIDEEYIRKNSEAANRKWYLSKSQMERDSSLYGCLSLRSKLNLMGLDYCEESVSDISGLSEEEYLKIYAKGDMPVTDKNTPKIKGKKIVKYDLNFKDSLRKTMAIHEHQRWNSFMISKGMIPSTRKQISAEKIVTEEGKEKFTNGKNYGVRRHGNITTFDGLVEFRRIVALRDKKKEEETDVIKYDYQLLDDAHWLLSSCGYKIIKKQ